MANKKKPIRSAPLKTSTPVVNAASLSGVTRETLEATPNRALALLRGIGTSQPIMARMRVHGFTKADADEGWTLLLAASGFTAGETDENGAGTEARAAITELDAADEKLFRVLRATLGRHAPTLANRVLDGLSSGQGATVVVSVSTLLDRLDAAAKKPDAETKAALALLEQRGYGVSERERLRALTIQAQSVPNIDEEAPRLRAEAERAYLEKLNALRAWFEEWSEIARVAVTRRDQLIRLGLATRRIRSDAEGDDTERQPASAAE